MHIPPQILVALTIFAGVSVIKALPVDISPTTIDAIVQVLQQRADYCDGMTWEDQTSLGSPVVSDCLTLAERLGEYTWTIPTSGQKQISQVCTNAWIQLLFVWYHDRELSDTSQWGTCAFGVRNIDQRIATPTIGNDNVRDLIGGAVQMFEWNSRVGAKGVTSCRWNGGWTPIEWGLYHE